MLGDGTITGNVVAYKSAHIDGVASEKVVRSGHSSQSHPETIEEVRRILRELVDMLDVSYGDHRVSCILGNMKAVFPSGVQLRNL